MVLLGELGTTLPIALLGRFMDSYAPSLRVRVPTSFSMTRSPTLNTMAWMHVAWCTCYAGLCAMGNLVEGLEKLEADKLGV